MYNEIKLRSNIINLTFVKITFVSRRYQITSDMLGSAFLLKPKWNPNVIIVASVSHFTEWYHKVITFLFASFRFSPTYLKRIEEKILTFFLLRWFFILFYKNVKSCKNFTFLKLKAKFRCFKNILWAP